MTEDRLNQILKACAFYQNTIWRQRPLTPDENKAAGAAWDAHQDEFNKLAKNLYQSAIQGARTKTASALIALTDWAVMQIENIVPIRALAECWPEEARTNEILADLKAENLPHLAALVKESLEISTPHFPPRQRRPTILHLQEYNTRRGSTKPCCLVTKLISV